MVFCSRPLFTFHLVSGAKFNSLSFKATHYLCILIRAKNALIENAFIKRGFPFNLPDYTTFPILYASPYAHAQVGIYVCMYVRSNWVEITIVITAPRNNAMK